MHYDLYLIRLLIRTGSKELLGAREGGREGGKEER